MMSIRNRVLFSRKHKLSSLSDTQKNIVKKTNFPDILSATQLSAEGFNLVEMNVKLLKKTQQLTLRSIEQDSSFKAEIEQENNIKLRNERLEPI